MKKYFTFSGTMISYIQYFALSATIAGLFFVPWTIFWILISLFFFYLYGMVGMSMMLHRYWSHKTFEFKNKYLKNLFTLISILSARGSPIAWVHIHRTHHAYSDTEKDPHRPEKFKLFSFKTTYISKLNIFLIKDLMTNEQKFIHEYYLAFILIWCLILFAISPYLLYFAWILPVCLNQISQDLWNYFSHKYVGYRNFETKDSSRNVTWLWPLVLGEAWHNNHHNDPGNVSTKVANKEFDPIASLIRVVRV